MGDGPSWRRGTLEIRRKAFGPGDPRVAGTLNNLGLLAIATDDHARALTDLRHALEIQEQVLGPDNPKGGRMTLPFTLTIAEDGTSARLEIDGGGTLTLKLNEYSDWVELGFTAGMGAKAAGIAKFYLISTAPHVNLYMTPIHSDP